MKKLFITSIFLITSLASFAQETKATEVSIFSDPMFPMYVLTGFIFIVLLLIMAVAMYIIKILNLFARKAAEEKAAKEGRVYVPEPGLIESFMQRLNASVPVADEKSIELDHSYDGIKELDNHLPPWWKWLFYGTIVWAVVYVIVYHITDSVPLQTQEYENEVTMAEEAKQKFLASQPVTVIDENALVYSNDPAILESGKKAFITNNCQSCHRADGGGNAIGPNLTDEYWLHGGSIKQIFATIKNGVVEKGMPAWGKVMKPSDVRDVAFYVMSLQGSNPKDAKAPQGQQEKPAEPAVKSDSTKTVASAN
ncbi:MAG TPA: cbb3-type cytochrome c oxidase N-terminal domain-containing protein [Cyclobacteriaceae bacterium]|nr:cbb3-type cytochrome c oxidase N-terminal domain-containing protein [Cyclobacteriaceae bacterium]